MSSLVNRVPTGRIVSLHAELRYLNWRFKTNSFTLQEMKLDPTLEKTQLDFFPLAVENSVYGRYNGKYDPYLDNPLDRSGFHLTQSTERDSQKSKSASECFSALEGLGWVERAEDGKGTITDLGKKAASLDYFDDNFLGIIKESLLGYGPFIGFLFECQRKSIKDVIKRKDIVIGYTNTNEVVRVGNQSIPISVGSQDDSITRTRSTLIAWAITAGYLWPVGINLPKDDWHKEALSLLKSKKWTWTKFRILIPKNLFSINREIIVSHPLSYKWMTKSTKALRERGQGVIRNTTLQIESKVKNRRFAIIYSLSISSSKNKNIIFSKLIAELKKFPDEFVIDTDDFERVMRLELGQMSLTSGMIFAENRPDELVPLVKLNMVNLEFGAPEDLIYLLQSINKNI